MHPIVGWFAMRELRAGALVADDPSIPMPTVQKSYDASVPAKVDFGREARGMEGPGQNIASLGGKVTDDDELNDDRNAQLPLLFPLLIFCEDRLDVGVTAWTDVEISRKEVKIFYEVNVRLRTKPLRWRSTTFDGEISDVAWVVRKRYRQFRALAIALERSGLLDDIECPVKYSKRRPKILDRETEVKVPCEVIVKLF